LFKIGQVEASEDGDYEKMHFRNWFLWAVHDNLLDPKLFYCGCVPSQVYISGQNNRYWQSINLRHTIELFLHHQKIGVCCVPCNRTYLFWTEQCPPLFLSIREEERRYGYCMQNCTIAHTHTHTLMHTHTHCLLLH
jgi:hypothetical protein